MSYRIEDAPRGEPPVDPRLVGLAHRAKRAGWGQVLVVVLVMISLVLRWQSPVSAFVAGLAGLAWVGGFVLLGGVRQRLADNDETGEESRDPQRIAQLKKHVETAEVLLTGALLSQLVLIGLQLAGLA